MQQKKLHGLLCCALRFSLFFLALRQQPQIWTLEHRCAITDRRKCSNRWLVFLNVPTLDKSKWQLSFWTHLPLCFLGQFSKRHVSLLCFALQSFSTFLGMGHCCWHLRMLRDDIAVYRTDGGTSRRQRLPMSNAPTKDVLFFLAASSSFFCFSLQPSFGPDHPSTVRISVVTSLTPWQSTCVPFSFFWATGSSTAALVVWSASLSAREEAASSAMASCKPLECLMEFVHIFH